MPRPTAADSVMPTDWSTRPSSSMATQRAVKSGVRPAELLGRDQPEQAQVAHQPDQLDREAVLRVPLRGMRRHLVGGEVADHLPEVLVLLEQLEHGPTATFSD